MSLKYSNTTSDYIPFETASSLGYKLLNSTSKSDQLLGRYIIIAINTGLRNSDLIKLTNEDLTKDIVTIIYKKEKREITFAINERVHSIIPNSDDKSPFTTNQGSLVSIQYLNRKLKEVFHEEHKCLNISTHTLRKTFARRVYDNNGQSEKALVYIKNLFNHDSLGTTIIYIGIRKDVYQDINQDKLNEIYMKL